MSRLKMVAMLLGGLAAGALLAGCANKGDDAFAPRTVDHVDLKRYQGTWYELARLPMFFQRNCAQSEAHYRLKPDGNIAVLNRCRTEKGEWEEATGTASPQVPGKTDKLWVVFDNWFSKILPGVAKQMRTIPGTLAVLRCAAAALALERYRLAHGRWPEALEALTPNLLAQVPADAYDGQPLRVRRLDDSVIVYSVGPDGEDNGGRIDRRNPGASGTDLGFRLWDVDKRWQPGPRQ